MSTEGLFSSNRVCKLLEIEVPVVQGGMVWCSGWRLASAVSNAGGLGLIGSGSMYPEVLEQHIIACKLATSKPFGVNVPLLYPNIDQHIDTIIKQQVPVVFTSAGNPKTWTQRLQSAGIRVVHVVSSTMFALKAQDAGVDAVVAEGFEAGGHNGRDETTTLCLIPAVSEAVDIPVLAAGGIGSGRSMLAAMVLGAEGVQLGTLFAASVESSAHDHFKQRIVSLKEGDTELSLKKLTPVRLIKNEFYQRVKQAELEGASVDTLRELLGKGRAKLGMFEGNMEEGELEIGQVASSIDAVRPVEQIMNLLLQEYKEALLKVRS